MTSTFGLFWLWEETGYEVSKFCCRGEVNKFRQKSKPVKSRVANFSRKEGALLLGFSGCGKKQVMYGM